MSLALSSLQSASIRVDLEPVYNTLNSFSLLTMTGDIPSLNVWVLQTAATLTPESQYNNRLVFEGLCAALLPGQDTPDFATYLKNLAAQNPYALRDDILEWLSARFSRRVSSDSVVAGPSTERLLSDLQAYLTCVEYVQVDTPFDPVLQTEVHHLLNDAPSMHHLLVSHLEALWKTTFVTEWKRVQRFLHWQVEMFTRSLDLEASIDETFYTFTGRTLPAELSARLADSKEIVLVPSWHMGRHVTLWEDDMGGSRLFFSEPPNYDVSLLRAAMVGRGELRARLDALADETRLRIVELLARQDEMAAQDIIVRLDLSQSSVSRHLKQLVSMGYLYERRGEGASKTYRLSSFYFARTARALEQLVSGEHTRTTGEEDASQPQELRRFLDRSGKLTLWPPAKQRDKLIILEYLASFFELGRVYNEKEVNDLLMLHSVVKDSAALRRALQEYRFMARTRDGSQYWLLGSEMLEMNSDSDSGN